MSGEQPRCLLTPKYRVDSTGEERYLPSIQSQLQRERNVHVNPIIRNILAVVAGLIVGSMVNMGLIMVSGSVIPLPPGVDASNMESLKSSMHLFEAKHFLFPFLAHALGTLAGAWLAALIAAGHKVRFALGIGAFFMIGGVMNVFLLPSPAWFAVLDLAAAYIPMGFLGGTLATLPAKKR